MSDQIVINVIEDSPTLIKVGESFGLVNHSVTHQAGGSDELLHNLLGGLQGGTGNQYYHLTQSQYDNLVTGAVVRPSETGQFYPASNPSGFITGVDLSNYATIPFVSGVSGDLQSGLNVTNQKLSTAVFITGNQDISGLKDFQTRPTVLDIPVLVSGDAVDTIHLYGKNDQGATIYKGQPVYINSANGNNPLIQLASNTGERTSSKTIGLLAQDLAVNEFGYVITEGLLEGFNTSSGVAGDPMWLGPTGNIIYGLANKPYGNNHLVYLGIVLRSNNNNGRVYVKVQNGFEIDELHKVYALNPSNKDTLLYNSGSGAWFARQLDTGDISGINNYVLNNQTGQFYPSNNPSGFITGVDLTSYATNSFVTSISGNLQNQISSLNSQTGSYVTGEVIRPSQTGQFYAASNPSGFITGVDLSSYATNSFVTGISGGLQAQISSLNSQTGSYVTGQVVRPFETGQFYPISNPSGYISIVEASGNFIPLINPVITSGTLNNAVTFNATTYTFGAGAASALKTAIGADSFEDQNILAVSLFA